MLRKIFPYWMCVNWSAKNQHIIDSLKANVGKDPSYIKVNSPLIFNYLGDQVEMTKWENIHRFMS